MSQGTVAEMFIETLSEMLADERARRSVRALRSARAQADRFLSQSFGDDAENRHMGRQPNIARAAGLDQTQ